MYKILLATAYIAAGLLFTSVGEKLEGNVQRH